MDPLLSKLTIALPVYNEEAYIRETLESCKDQAGAIVIYDNASTDGTSDICSEFARMHSHVQHIRHTENIGAHENMRYAVFNCTTEYCALMGAHDLLGPDYSRPLMSTLEKDSSISLAVGTIQHIDEKGALLRRRTEHDWVNDIQNATPLYRVEAFVSRLRDCFMFYGIFRTAQLQKAWFDQACLGFDRIVLVRAAAHGKAAYVKGPVYFARNFDNVRDSKKDRERRSQVLGSKPIAKNNLLRNKIIAETAFSLVQTDDDLTQAFRIADKVNRRLHNRRLFQRRRLLKIAVAVIAMMGAALLLFY